jgi:hypothetical protein
VDNGRGGKEPQRRVLRAKPGIQAALVTEGRGGSTIAQLVTVPSRPTLMDTLVQALVGWGWEGAVSQTVTEVRMTGNRFIRRLARREELAEAWRWRMLHVSVGGKKQLSTVVWEAMCGGESEVPPAARAEVEGRFH